MFFLVEVLDILFIAKNSYYRQKCFIYLISKEHCIGKHRKLHNIQLLERIEGYEI